MLLYFPLFVGVAVYLRRKPEAHKRLMLASCIVMLDPVMARCFSLFMIAGLPLEYAVDIASAGAPSCCRAAGV